ncbi:DNA-3-methyladenine glycosylase [Paenibacillus alkaliterrae]|uniref:DNA-3-methyladenine glycosylase family protein n=1 Tax=Paenibacillus alkaliterrae TaxID=320909 RepID=UPI001F36BAA3|nr:DNA-3-methyladenine glycosylase [Paenibacillus alkaliterrae]MCF2937764.1 DNA-3-methyladenine glycosylase [Paenibacillus alkaliterrae]
MSENEVYPQWEDHGHTLKLFVPQPFSFAENMKYLSNAPNECLFHIKEQRLYRAIPIEGETLVIEISSDHDHSITVRFMGDTAPSCERVRSAVVRYVRDWFDLDTDLLPFYKLAKSDPLLHRAADSFHGLRVIGIPDLFEAICWGIIGQQINLTYAYTLKRRFVERFGRHVSCEGESYWLFPSAQEIAVLAVEDLAELRMTVKKCEYLIGTAKLIAEGRMSKELLTAAGDLKTAEKLLVNLRGIGPWTANYVLMRCLRMPSAFPIDDVGLHNAIKYVMGTEKKPSKEEILKLSKAWTGWESYATFYLWRFLY